jgi:hypothetical protein
VKSRLSVLVNMDLGFEVPQLSKFLLEYFLVLAQDVLE